MNWFFCLFVCWNKTRIIELRLLSWEGSKPHGSDHTGRGTLKPQLWKTLITWLLYLFPLKHGKKDIQDRAWPIMVVPVAQVHRLFGCPKINLEIWDLPTWRAKDVRVSFYSNVDHDFGMSQVKLAMTQWQWWPCFFFTKNKKKWFLFNFLADGPTPRQWGTTDKK